MSFIHHTNTPREVVIHNPMLSIVFERFGMASTTNDIPLRRIDKRQCPDVNFLVEVLRAFDQPDGFDPSRFHHFSTYIILDYLYRTHRYYVDKRLLEIERSIDSLTLAYGQDHPLLTLLNNFFSAYSKQMVKHIKLEEDTLFPYVLHLVELVETPGMERADSVFGNYQLAAFAGQHEADELDAQLGNLRQLIHDQYPELTGTFPFMILSSQLDAFERDLYIHECIEEEVLMPRAKELERRAMG